MILKQSKKQFNKALKGFYPQTETDSFFYLLIEKYLDFKRIDIVLKSDYKIPKKTISLIEQATIRLQQYEPIQYILGEATFYGFPFLVNRHVLIPRPETEELLEWIIDVADSSVPLQVLDIGTGTGCIPISLAKLLPNAHFYGIDICENALLTAKKNAALNDVNVQFILQDILTTSELNQYFDIIVSNPPYVREIEKKEINDNVLKNEPHLALFVEDSNPLIFYSKIADLAKKHLNKNGVLFFEINQYLGKETLSLLSNKGFHQIELKKDLFGNDRMIKARI